MVRQVSYNQFNFLLRFAGVTDMQAGFQECSGLGPEPGSAEYRAGNGPPMHVRKITGINKTSDVTLKRGVIGEASLSAWLEETRTGQNAQREVVLMMQSEDPTKTAQLWTLSCARIVKCTGDLLNSKEAEVALEELVLRCERVNAV